jgi:hypothetical protein
VVRRSARSGSSPRHAAHRCAVPRAVSDEVAGGRAEPQRGREPGEVHVGAGPGQVRRELGQPTGDGVGVLGEERRAQRVVVTSTCPPVASHTSSACSSPPSSSAAAARPVASTVDDLARSRARAAPRRRRPRAPAGCGGGRCRRRGPGRSRPGGARVGLGLERPDASWARARSGGRRTAARSSRRRASSVTMAPRRAAPIARWRRRARHRRPRRPPAGVRVTSTWSAAAAGVAVRARRPGTTGRGGWSPARPARAVTAAVGAVTTARPSDRAAATWRRPGARRRQAGVVDHPPTNRREPDRRRQLGPAARHQPLRGPRRRAARTGPGGDGGRRASAGAGCPGAGSGRPRRRASARSDRGTVEVVRRARGSAAPARRRARRGPLRRQDAGPGTVRSSQHRRADPADGGGQRPGRATAWRARSRPATPRAALPGHGQAVTRHGTSAPASTSAPAAGRRRARPCRARRAGAGRPCGPRPATTGSAASGGSRRARSRGSSARASGSSDAVAASREASTTMRGRRQGSQRHVRERRTGLAPDVRQRGTVRKAAPLQQRQVELDRVDPRDRATSRAWTSAPPSSTTR